MVQGAQDDYNAAVNLVNNARSSVEGDFQQLASYIDISSGSLTPIISGIVQNVLTEQGAVYMNYGKRALEVVQKLKEVKSSVPGGEDKSEPEEDRLKTRGRDVAFPEKAYPAFYLGTIATDLITPNDWKWEFDLANISSDPDLTGGKTTLKMALESASDGSGYTGSVDASADFRTDAQELWQANVAGGGFPVSMTTALSSVGAGAFESGSSFTVRAAGLKGGDFNAGGGAKLTNPSLDSASNTIMEAVRSALDEVSSLDLDIDFGQKNGDGYFDVTTNIDELVKNAVMKMAEQYTQMAKDRLREELNKVLA
jgi:hypothetical protein